MMIRLRSLWEGEPMIRSLIVLVGAALGSIVVVNVFGLSYEQDLSDEPVAAVVVWALLLIGAVGGAFVADRLRPSRGDVRR
jgi:uncharacterized membrane protein YdfJ with MMPL/SSD domain